MPAKKSKPVPARAGQKTNLILSPEAVKCLERLKSCHGISQTFAVSRGVILLEQSLTTFSQTN